MDSIYSIQLGLCWTISWSSMVKGSITGEVNGTQTCKSPFHEWGTPTLWSLGSGGLWFSQNSKHTTYSVPFWKDGLLLYLVLRPIMVCITSNCSGGTVYYDILEMAQWLNYWKEVGFTNPVPKYALSISHYIMCSLLTKYFAIH